MCLCGPLTCTFIFILAAEGRSDCNFSDPEFTTHRAYRLATVRALPAVHRESRQLFFLLLSRALSRTVFLFVAALNPDFPDGWVVSVWRLRLLPAKLSVSNNFLLK
jgi:hypothetical protein